MIIQDSIPLSEATDMDTFNPQNPCAHVQTISNKKGFYILTSLLWTRGVVALDDTIDQLAVIRPSKGPSGRSKLPLKKLLPDLGLLSYHRDRLAAAAKALSWRHITALHEHERGLEELRRGIHTHMKSLPALRQNVVERRKLRICVSKDGNLAVNSTVMELKSEKEAREKNFMPDTLDLAGNNDEPCQVFVDSRPTRPSLFTTHKTGHRPHYDAARHRAGITPFAPTEKEVLLYNRDGEIMEASLCTVFFFRDGGWITPAAICGGVLGVTRRLALENNLCKQGLVEVSEIKDGEKVWLSNAARGFFVGQIAFPESSPVLLPSNPGLDPA